MSKRRIPRDDHTTSDKIPEKPAVIMEVKAQGPAVRIRTGPGANYPHNGRFVMDTIEKIVEVVPGEGSTFGWGLLENHRVDRSGWVNLDFVKIVKQN